MAVTLTKGFVKPQNPDTGATFFPQIETDIQQLNDHTHNNADSQPLAKTQTILAASWGASGSGYTQVVTLPGSLTYDTISIQHRLSTGDLVYPTVTKASATSYNIFVNDNTLQLTAVYI